MQKTKFFLCSLLVVVLIYLFDHELGPLPPVGKLTDPVHGFMANADNDDDLQNIEIIGGLHEANANPITSSLSGNIYLDDRLVPHIYAADNYSLYFLQGYVTAKYRLWQMDIQTRAAGGRLSEVLGTDLMNYDREQRRTGMVYAAENALSELEKDDEIFECVEAYTAGVNEYIHSLSYCDYPLEYKLINFKPEDWGPLKTMLLLKYMASDLTGFDDDIEYTNNLKLLGRKDFDILFPDRPAGIVPIIPAEKKYDFTPEKIDTAVQQNEIAFFEKDAQSLRDDHEDNVTGSNNWVIGKEKTQNGHPILCNDPHLQLNLPSLWFEIQLNAPGVNCYGASLPGAPAIIIGFNDSIAWGVTNAQRDVRDWYTIEFKDASRKEYKIGDGFEQTVQRIETIKVKGHKDVIDTVLYTHYGPIVYDGTEKNNEGHIKPSVTQRANLAMRWAAHDASTEFKTFYLLNRSQNYDDYKNALSYFSCPAQNIVFAAANGDIAITQQGKFAVKYPEQGRFVLNGSDTRNEWQKYIPAEENPSIKNPQQGYLASANQHPTDSTYPYYYTSFDFEFYRNRVINNVLQNLTGATVEDMEKLQQNNFNMMASEVLPFMLDLLAKSDTSLQALRFEDLVTTSGLTEQDKKESSVRWLYHNLATWNHENNPDLPEPTYFQIWWDTLYDILWDELYAEDIAFKKPNYYNTVQAIKNLPDDYKYFDIVKTSDRKETLTELISLSFYRMVHITDSIYEKNETIDALQWYKFKNTAIMHIAQILPFSRLAVHNGGYSGIVNATSHTHGPSWRMVVEMSQPVNAYGVYPGGQSGNPGSKYYDNFIDNWAAGKYYPLNFYADETIAAKDPLFTITFK